MAVVTNLFTNPRPASATSWAAIGGGPGGTISQSVISGAGGPGGDAARRLTWTAGSTSPGGGLGFATGTSVAAAPGSPYSAAIYTRCTRAQTVYPRIQWVDAASASLGILLGAPVTLVADTWTELKLENQIAPASTAFIRGGVVADALSSNWVTGDILDGQAGTVVQSATLPQPFHGAMTDDATHDYAWTGAADASTSTLTIPDPNAAPTANTGADQSAVEPWSTVSLTGSSSDSDGTVVARQWTQTAGPAVTLTGATTAAASFTAPGTLTGASLTFSYTVTDDDGATGTDMVTVTVLPAAERIMIGGVLVPARITIA